MSEKTINESEVLTPLKNSNVIGVMGIGDNGKSVVNNLYKTDINKITLISYNNDITEQDIVKLLEGIKMLFVVTSTNGENDDSTSTAIVKSAKELGILIITAAIVTSDIEKENVLDKIGSISNYTNSVFVFSSDKADEGIPALIENILHVISDSKIQIDIHDLHNSMGHSNMATIYSSTISDKLGSVDALENTLSSPLSVICSNDSAKDIIVHISYGEIRPHIIFDTLLYKLFSQFNVRGSIVWAECQDKSLGDKFRIIVITVN